MHKKKNRFLRIFLEKREKETEKKTENRILRLSLNQLNKKST